jgi:hypothetical protein
MIFQRNKKTGEEERRKTSKANSSHNTSTLEMTSIGMTCILHTKLETHGGYHSETQVDPSVLPD